MAKYHQKIWTYVGPSPSEISRFNHPVAENFSETFSDLNDYLIFLIRALAIKGYVFKPSQSWQEHYAFQAHSVPSWFQNEPTYLPRPTSHDPKNFIDTKDETVFELLSETTSGVGLMDVLSTTEIVPELVVYYDESGNTEFALEYIYFPLVRGFNLASCDDIRKLTYLASCSNQFHIEAVLAAREHTRYFGLGYDSYIALKESIVNRTVVSLFDMNSFDFFEQAFATACNTHVNGRPYVLPVWVARAPNKKEKDYMVDYKLAADMINKTLTRFLTTQAFILISAIKSEKGLNLEGDDMPKIDQAVRTYIMEPDEHLPKGWANDMKKVILAQAYRNMFMTTQEALL